MFYFVATLGVLFVILLLLLLFTWKNGISPTPTPQKVRRVLFSHLPELKKGIVFELGSGWGNLAIPLSKKYPTCKIIGYENSPIPYMFSSLLSTASNLKILREDFYERSLREASLIICYLYPKGMEHLKRKFEKELRPGTHIISHTHAIPGWEPKQTIDIEGMTESTIYIYETQTL